MKELETLGAFRVSSMAKLWQTKDSPCPYVSLAYVMQHVFVSGWLSYVRLWLRPFDYLVSNKFVSSLNPKWKETGFSK